MKNWKIKSILFLIVFCGLFGLSKGAEAATYYVCDTGANCNAKSSGWSAGNDSNVCTSKSSPCKTIKGGVGKMSGGDTLVIGDGIYTGTMNNLGNSSDPYGEYDITSKSGISVAFPTIIKCENYLGCTQDLGGVRSARVMGDYLRLENLFVVNGVYGLYVVGTHNKVINCAARDFASWSIALEGNYNLVEGCAAWGRGTYFMFAGSTESYNIFRRNIVRRDAHYGRDGNGNNYACYAVYDGGSHNFFQNDICIDSELNVGGENPYKLYDVSSFYTANNGNDFQVTGSIAINNFEWQTINYQGMANGVLRDSVVIAKPNQVGVGVLANNSGIFTNNLIKDIDLAEDYGGAICTYGGSATIKNNIIWSNRYGMNYTAGNKYNILYGNETNYRLSSVGTGEFTNINPALSIFIP